jgi:hypothetical protein
MDRLHKDVFQSRQAGPNFSRRAGEEWPATRHAGAVLTEGQSLASFGRDTVAKRPKFGAVGVYLDELRAHWRRRRRRRLLLLLLLTPRSAENNNAPLPPAYARHRDNSPWEGQPSRKHSLAPVTK